MNFQMVNHSHTTVRAYQLLRARERRHALAMSIAAGIVADDAPERALQQLLIHAGMRNGDVRTMSMTELLEKLRSDYAAWEDEPPSLNEVKALIACMSSSDRAVLRPHLLGAYDVQGWPVRHERGN